MSLVCLFSSPPWGFWVRGCVWRDVTYGPSSSYSYLLANPILTSKSMLESTGLDCLKYLLEKKPTIPEVRTGGEALF